MNKCAISPTLLASFLIGAPLSAGVFAPYDGEWKVQEVQLPAAVVNGTPSEKFEITSGDLTIADDVCALLVIT